MVIFFGGGYGGENIQLWVDGKLVQNGKLETNFSVGLASDTECYVSRFKKKINIVLISNKKDTISKEIDYYKYTTIHFAHRKKTIRIEQSNKPSVYF